MPASNAEVVAGQLVTATFDLDGQGVVEVLRLRLARAEDIQAPHRRAAAFDQRLLAGQVNDQMEVNAELLDALYEPVCLKWFLSRAMKALAEELEFGMHQRQGHLRAIEQITYTDNGGVESFRLAPPDP